MSDKSQRAGGVLSPDPFASADASEPGAEAHGEGSGGQARGGSFQEAMRRVLLGGASALLTTEEGIRNALSEVRLPKEVLGYVLQQTERTRREITGLVSKEVKKTLRRIDARKELQRALVGLKVDVRATIRFRRDDEGLPAVQLRSKVRRRPADRRGHAPEPTQPTPPAAAAASHHAAPSDDDAI